MLLSQKKKGPEGPVSGAACPLRGSLREDRLRFATVRRSGGPEVRRSAGTHALQGCGTSLVWFWGRDEPNRPSGAGADQRQGGHRK